MKRSHKAVDEWQKIIDIKEKLKAIEWPYESNPERMSEATDRLNSLTQELERATSELEVLLSGMSAEDRADFDERISSISVPSNDRCDELLSGDLSFVRLSEDERRDKDFIIECIERGVSPAMLRHVSPYVLFTRYPPDEISLNEWHKSPLEFDAEFFRRLCELSEHSFWNFWSNPDIEVLVGDGYEKFDLWDNEEAWLAAVQNPKFIKYFSDLELQEIIDDWDGFPDLQSALKAQITSISGDLKTFAATILDEYFPNYSLAYIEESYGIDLGDKYLSAVINNTSDKLVFSAEPDKDDIYGLSNLAEFEALITFVNKNTGN